MTADEDEYDLADAPTARPRETNMPVSHAAAAAQRYPHRTIKPIAEEPDAVHAHSLFRNLIVPIVLISLGLALRVAQLLYANEGRGNRWSGNLATPTGIGKAVGLVSIEMLVACAIMGIGAVVAAMMLGVEFGPISRAAMKLCGVAVFTIGIASWVALFDSDRFSIGGLVLALHVMVVLNWLLLGFFFKIELQELLLTVAIITALHALAMAAMWRA